MLLNNRAYPEWISVECDINQPVDVVCTRNSATSTSKETKQMQGVPKSSF